MPETTLLSTLPRPNRGLFAVASGVVPQNVNYAMRTEFITKLLGAAPVPTTTVRREADALGAVVDRAEASVYLVIARSAAA